VTCRFRIGDGEIFSSRTVAGYERDCRHDQHAAGLEGEGEAGQRQDEGDRGTEANEDGDEGVGVKFEDERDPTMTTQNRIATINRQYMAGAKIRTVQSNCAVSMFARPIQALLDGVSAWHSSLHEAVVDVAPFLWFNDNARRRSEYLPPASSLTSEIIDVTGWDVPTSARWLVFVIGTIRLENLRISDNDTAAPPFNLLFLC